MIAGRIPLHGSAVSRDETAKPTNATTVSAGGEIASLSSRKAKTQRFVVPSTVYAAAIKSIIACFYRMRLPPVLRHWLNSWMVTFANNRNHLLGISLLALVGCSSITVPKTVNIPIVQKCVTSVPTPPVFPTNEQLQNMSEGDFVLSLANGYKLLQDDDNQLRALLQACE